MIDKTQLIKDWFCLKTNGMYQEEVINFCNKEKVRIVSQDPLIIELIVINGVCPELDEFVRGQYKGQELTWL